MNEITDFQFSIIPQPRSAQLDVSEGNYFDVVFSVQNLKNRPVRVEAFVEALEGPPTVDNPTGAGLSPQSWGHWLSINLGEQETNEWLFEPNGVRTVTVRVQINSAASLRQGTYRFRLLIIGVDDPDHQLAQSEIVTFTVVGPQINIRRFVLVALIFLAVVIALAVGAALLFEPEPRLNVVLIPPAGGQVGEVMTYTVTVQNSRSFTATEVVLNYKQPAGIVASTAAVSNAAFRLCDEGLDGIRCNLGNLGPQEIVTVTLQTVPGPATSIITHTNSVTASNRLENRRAITPAEVSPDSVPISPATNVSVVIDPSSSIATVEEPVTYRFLVWNNVTNTQGLTLTYQLPKGMRFAHTGAEADIVAPANCSQLVDDYFTLLCDILPLKSGAQTPEVAELNVVVVPTETSPQLKHQVSITTPGIDSVPAQSTHFLQVVNSALQFDGIDDYAELGYNVTPETFTVEMWVHPFNNSDGQSFIGVHRASLDNLNLFLVGYWSDSLNITVGDDFHGIDGPKLTERYHLAVTVEKKNAQESEVTVFINGQAQSWLEPESAGVCENCKIFQGALDGGLSLPWVLGQDWDPIGNSRRPSDFFQGAISDVRIWSEVRSQEEILNGMRLRPQGDEANLVAYLRLDPIDPESSVLLNQVGPDGQRLGASWGEPVPRFGNALVFDGRDDAIVVPNARLSNFEVTEDGKVEVTMAGWILVDNIPSEEEWILGFSGAGLGAISAAALPDGPIDAALTQTIDTVTGAQQTQTELAAAQAQLISALENRDALGMTFEEAREALEASRNTVYLTLDPLTDQGVVENVYSPVANIISSAEAEAAVGDLERLQSVQGLQSAVAETLAARSVFNRVQSAQMTTRANSIRQQYQQRQTQLAYAQSLVDLWQILASNQITETGIINTSRNSNDANSAADMLTNVAQNINNLPPPEQALLRLAALELAEQQQLASSFFELTLPAATPTPDPASQNILSTLTTVDNTVFQAAQSIANAQLAFTTTLTALQPWLENQLDTDVRLLLFPELSGEIRDEPLRQRLLQESGLVGYWDFNEGGGQIVQDRSGNGQQGTFVDDTAFISSVPPSSGGPNPFALTFDGVGDRLEIQPSTALNVASGTFSLWFNANPNISDFRMMLGYGPETGNQAWAYRLYLDFTNPGVPAFDFRNTDAQFILRANTPANDNQWHHLAATRDDVAKIATIYVDGQPSGTISYTGQIQFPSQPLWLGQSPFNGGANPYIGSLDDVRIYNRVLSPEEIAILAGGNAPVNIDEQLTLQKLLGLRAIEELQMAQQQVQAVETAERELAEAQARVAEADSEADRIAAITAAAEMTLQERQQLINRVTTAQAAVAAFSSGGQPGAGVQPPGGTDAQQPGAGATEPGTSAAGTVAGTAELPPPTNLAEAQAQLDAAQAALTAAQLRDLRTLQSDIEALNLREETLQDLNERLNKAVDNAVEAGLQAAQKNNIELLIGPYLDWILRTRTPRRSTREVVYDAAFLAAQQALKSDVDFNVDAAQARLDAALEARDRLINSGGNSRLRQNIIDNINAYIESLSSEVKLAEQELNDALAAQQGRETAPEIPLVLADAMADEVARRVANQLAFRIRPSFTQLLNPNPEIGPVVKTQVKAEMVNALAATRNPVRWQLYINTYFVLLQLNQEITSGVIDNEAELRAATEVQEQLTEVNLALLQVLNSQNVVLQPTIGFQNLINQVAEERNRATSEAELIDDLQSKLNNAKIALDIYIPFRETAERFGFNPASSKMRGVAKIRSSVRLDTQQLELMTWTLIDDIIVPAQEGDPGAGDPTGEATGEDPALLQGVDEPAPDETTTDAAIQPDPDPTLPLVVPNIWLGLVVDEDGHVSVVGRPRSLTTWTAVKDEKPLPVGQWVHYAAVVTIDVATGTVEEMRLYRNGDEVKGYDLVNNPLTVGFDRLTNCTPDFFIGGLCPSANDFSFAGRIDEVRIWNHALTEEEVDGWRDLPGEFFNEYAYWAFDDGPGRTNAELCALNLTCDRSTNGFHLQVLGPAWIASDFGLENRAGGSRP